MADLTTLAIVKAWIPGLNATVTTADATLSALITATSADFYRATNRPDLLQANYSEVRTGDGSCRLALRHWPVDQVSNLTIAGIAVAQSPDGVQAGWYLNATSDPELAFVLFLANSVFSDGQPVSINYSAGYAAPPADVQQAVTEWVALRYQRRPTTGQTQTRNSEGDHTDFSADDIPPNTQRVIDRYIRQKPAYARPTQPEAVSSNGRGQGARRNG